MRILGFKEKWLKLEADEFTTFRRPRKDKDWQVGEVVQIVYRPRSKGREVLGRAIIVSKEGRSLNGDGLFPRPTFAEAIADGFDSIEAMLKFFQRTYGGGRPKQCLNKLTLRKAGVNFQIRAAL
jgi:hypothetical protein